MKIVRTVLVLASILTLAGVTAAVSKDNDTSRKKLMALNMASFGQGSLSEQALKILHYASLAPSGHNTQPWKITVSSPDAWTLGVDKASLLPAVDPEGRETMLSLGAFLENLVIAAANLGYSADCRLTAASPKDSEILEIKLAGGTEQKQDIPLEQLERRRTIRKGQLPLTIEAKDIEYVSNHAPGKVHYFPRGSKEAELISVLTLEANRVQTDRDDAQAELADWIRWSGQDAKEHRTGLTPASMEIGGLAGWFTSHFFSRETVLGRSFRKKGVDMVKAQVQEGGGWLIITSPDSGVGELLAAGRAFERLFLKAGSRNIAIHPMTQALEEGKFKKEIHARLGIQEDIQFILRVGYVKNYPDPVSVRKPVAWFAAE